MDFKPLTLSDIDTVRPYFQHLTSNTCDYSVGGMFMWREYFNVEYALEDGFLFTRLFDRDGRVHYNLPLSEDMTGALRRLTDCVPPEERPIRFCTVPEAYLSLLERECGVLRVEAERDFFDYLYDAADLITLKGKKYSGQRNQISQFKRGVDSWDFREIDGDTIGSVIRFFEAEYGGTTDAGEYAREENAKVREVLHNLDRYAMTGGVLTADGAVVGFSLVEAIRDTLYVHIEKADRTCKGAYQMLVNQAAARFAAGGVAYINREEDMGDPGLRTSKESYHPVQLLKKYTVEAR